MSEHALKRGEESASSKSDVVAGWLSSILRVLDAGDLAALRRLDPERPSAPAYWRLVAAMPDADADAPWRAENERRYAVVLRTFAALRGVHCGGRRLGRSLAESGFDERRVLQLLRARRSALAHAIRTACHFLVSKGVTVDAWDIAQLVLSEDTPGEDRERRRVARDFFGDRTRAERRAEGENR